MEFFLVLLVAILVLKPSDAKALAKFLGQCLRVKKRWQQKWQSIILETEKKTSHE